MAQKDVSRPEQGALRLAWEQRLGRNVKDEKRGMHVAGAEGRALRADIRVLNFCPNPARPGPTRPIRAEPGLYMCQLIGPGRALGLVQEGFFFFFFNQ